MENYQSLASQVQTPVGQVKLKESIRDMIRLQRDYQLSDELFWEVFNTRVLLNEQIDVNAFLSDLNAPVAVA
ncbi:hypothetical protein EXU85_28055 [Spirosoma sp. KCTC 42546]|uniref:hypothetical protein n=1 Tax=Spirosoma sp. KCTC 42546 TaxID=2520506 RepID=UPI00115A53E7|nr:hypothetical protein [Spirosoma sp. KCTC 42546]QDK82257.1 hypothetical protein EXU85_28055 [Spirosoma sp. KCTC 42546]